MKVIGMMLVRNECDRWLQQCLYRLSYICDKIIVLDDDSTDNTAQICIDHGCTVYYSKESLWGKNELAQRKKLFELTTSFAENNDWIVCLDADELFVLKHLPYIEYLFNTVSNQINGIAFRLYDMWSETHYREDNYWKSHFNYWTMAIRYQENFNYRWNEKPLHCGRFPQNSAPSTLPTMIPVKHMGWSTVEDRVEKYKRYMSIDPNGVNGWHGQYQSILDKEPVLKKFYRE